MIIASLCGLVERVTTSQDEILDVRKARVDRLQVEPCLYLGMGQVCLYHEAPEKFFSSGVDFKRYKDT